MPNFFLARTARFGNCTEPCKRTPYEWIRKTLFSLNARPRYDHIYNIVRTYIIYTYRVSESLTFFSIQQSEFDFDKCNFTQSPKTPLEILKLNPRGSFWQYLRVFFYGSETLSTRNGNAPKYLSFDNNESCTQFLNYQTHREYLQSVKMCSPLA